MSSLPPSLDDLRREIDVIDDGIHDLLMRRAEIVGRIGSLKARERVLTFHPAREASILRRLIGRHRGTLPGLAVVRIWRELLSALTYVQGAFAVAVFVPEGRPGYWDVARDHFGSYVPMMAANSPVAAVRAVSEGSASVAIVPFPAEDDSDPWWRSLANGDATAPRIIARLPFGGRGNGRGEDRDAVVVGYAAHEPSGDDRTMLSIEISGDISRGRFKDLLDAAGLPITAIYTWYSREGEGPSVHLVEVGDFVPSDDGRLGALLGRFGDMPVRIGVLGGYAQPLRHHADGR